MKTFANCWTFKVASRKYCLERVWTFGPSLNVPTRQRSFSNLEPGFDFKRSEPERAPTTSCSPDENVDICLQIELQGSHVAKVDLVDAGVTPSPDKPNACDHFLDDSFYVSVQKDEDSEEGLSCHFETAQELLQETVDQPVTPDLSTGAIHFIQDSNLTWMLDGTYSRVPREICDLLLVDDVHGVGRDQV